MNKWIIGILRGGNIFAFDYNHHSSRRGITDISDIMYCINTYKPGLRFVVACRRLNNGKVVYEKRSIKF